MMREITFREALKEALIEEMTSNPYVLLIGEDIGAYGGGFGVTRGLLEKFGEERILETPVSETAFVGTAIGAAMTGLRPVVEIMFSDFMGVCFDQIINEAAKVHFMYNGQFDVPIVLRSPVGAGTGMAAQHSQSLEAVFCHIPGLKVVMPSDPYAAKGLLKQSIRDEDPVIFLEHKLLYETRGYVPVGEYTLPLGRADIKRAGSDISIISYGYMTKVALEAASILSHEGIDPEVVDLGTLSPLDTATILASVARTHRALIVHEAVKFGGFGGEIASCIAESRLSMELKCPLKRLGGAFSPVPSAPGSEKNMFPTAHIVADTCREMFKYERSTKVSKP